VTYSDKPNFN